MFRCRRSLRLFWRLQIELCLLPGMPLCHSGSGRVLLGLLQGECRCDGGGERGIDWKD